MSLNVRQVVAAVKAGEFLLPTFQRDYVWTPQQIVRLFDSFRHGYHVGSLLLWDRYLPPREVEIGGVRAMSDRRVMVVLDGHQRLASIVRAATSERFSFDLLSGQLVLDAEPAPWIAPAHAVIDCDFNWLFESADVHAERWGVDPHAWRRLILGLNEVFERSFVSAIRLESDYDLAGDRDVPPDQHRRDTAQPGGSGACAVGASAGLQRGSPARTPGRRRNPRSS
jgi:hypothetical protein